MIEEMVDRLIENAEEQHVKYLSRVETFKNFMLKIGADPVAGSKGVLDDMGCMVTRWNGIYPVLAVELMPLSVEDDIGNGCGMAITKTF